MQKDNHNLLEKVEGTKIEQNGSINVYFSGIVTVPELVKKLETRRRNCGCSRIISHLIKRNKRNQLMFHDEKLPER